MTASTLARPALAAHAAGALPVGSYARRSKRAAGDGKGAFINIADQHEQNRAYAAVHFPGVPVIEYDDNISAWNPDVTRDDWERLLEDTNAGQLRAVVGRYADRLTRQPEQGEALLSACKRTRTELHTTSAGHITSALMFRMELAMAAEESDQKSRRMTDKHRTLATAGEFHGGRRRFGYNADMSEFVDVEADAIRDAATRVLNGESLASITRLWNDAGLLTPTGKAWRSPNVGKLLRGPHLAGIRIHHDADGNCAAVAAKWDGILDADTHESLVRFLGDPARVVTGFAGVRKHALSGLLTCAVCGTPCYGRETRATYGAAYICRNGQHVHAPTADVEPIIRALVIERLATVDASGVFVAPVDAARANARAAERLALAATRRGLPALLTASPPMAPADYAAALAAVDARVAELDDEAAADDDAARLPSRVLKGLTGVPADVVAERYDALPWDRQRAVVAVLGVPVLGRASRKGVGLTFEPERVTMTWADGPL